MKITYWLLLIFLSLTACNTVQADRQHIVTNLDTTAGRHSEPADRVMKFYNWYLKNIYLREAVEGPQLVLNSDSTQYHLDLTNHLEFLRTSGYFSDKFYEHELPACKACAAKLSRLNARALLRAGGSPIDPVDGRACAFLGWMPWTGGQGETLNTVSLVDTKVKGDTARVTVMLGDSSDESYSYPIVTLLMEQNTWKIARIDISYSK